MPTGYTAAVIDGEITELNEFILSCSRAFDIRFKENMDGDTKILPSREIPDRYEREVEEARKELEEARNLSDSEAYELAKQDFAEQCRHWDEHKKQKAENLDRLQYMLDQVKQWIPPTSQHEGIKNFMIQQLEDTIEHDGTPYDFLVPTQQTPVEYKRNLIKDKERWLEIKQESLDRERSNAEQRHFWWKNLFESLGIEDYEEKEVVSY